MMEEMSGSSNWNLIIERNPRGITLLRACTCDRRATLPDELFGLPVTALGHHALSPTGRVTGGEEVHITCGPGGEKWDNTALEELTIPDSVTRIGDYAFLNCRSLRRMTLNDNIETWGGGTTINCPNLAEFDITRGRKQGESLRYLTDTLSRELDVTIHRPEDSFRLVFPEYVEIYEENCPAHIFEYTIQGAGYPYHHCFRGNQLDMLEYDKLWPGLLAMEYEEQTALRLCWYRLRYPVELSEKAEALYLDYLRKHVDKALLWLLEEGTASDLTALLNRTEPTREQMSAAAACAREKGAAEVLAVLLEAMNRRFSRKKSFNL